MKKDLIFAPIMLLAGAALFLLKFTGMPVHIAVSVAGILILVAYTVLTKQAWKHPVLEIIVRAFYGVALISGIVMMRLHGIVVLSVVHKACAALFVVLFAALLVYKLVSAKKH